MKAGVLSRRSYQYIVELFIPVAVMIILPVILILWLKRLGWMQNWRDASIALFTGMMAVYFILTIIGAGFRGAGQDLVMPWDVPKID